MGLDGLRRGGGERADAGRGGGQGYKTTATGRIEQSHEALIILTVPTICAYELGTTTYSTAGSLELNCQFRSVTPRPHPGQTLLSTQGVPGT